MLVSLVFVVRTFVTGLGLRTPSPEFWQPVGETTGDMVIEDKINLLSYLVPRFGSGDPQQEVALDAFATGLRPTFALIRSKCPDLAESNVQLLGTELLCAEILVPGQSTKEEFASWLGAMTEPEMKDLLAARQKPRQEATDELAAFKLAREEESTRREDVKKAYDEQVDKARQARSMAFNPATGKFQELKRDKDKKK
jgi:hypothetical protein